jgi:hypothetical protein
MKYNILSLYLLTVMSITLFGNVTYSQVNFEWARQMGGSNDEVGQSIKVDFLGNVYTTGWFRGTCDFNPGLGINSLTSVGNEDIFVTKFDSYGNFIWSRRIGGVSYDDASSMVLDSLGNVYITGYFTGTVDFNPGPGSYNLTSFGMRDIFIIKLNALGNFVWAKNLGGTLNDYGNSIAIDQLGNLLIAGYFTGTADFDPGLGTNNLTSAGGIDVFVAKLDASGNLIWAKRWGGVEYDHALAVAVGSSGSVYTAGVFSNLVDFDPGMGITNFYSFGNLDIFVSKLDSSGNFVWAKQMGGGDNDWLFSMAVDGLDNVHTCGHFKLTADFDPGLALYNLTSIGDLDIFISKLDGYGNFIWAKQVGSAAIDYCRAIALDTLGNVYTTGSFQLTADFDPGLDSNNLTSFGDSDAYIYKLDSSGNFVWVQQLSSSIAESGYAITVDSLERIYTTGFFAGNTDFDPGTNSYILNPIGAADVFVHKLNQCPPPPAPTDDTDTDSLIICYNASTTLSALGTGTLGWYSDSVGGVYLGGGTAYNTGNLTASAIFYVQDSLCTISTRTPITVTVLPQLNASISSITNISCAGGSDGTATTFVSGGVSPYHYLWFPAGDTTITATGLSAGSYICTVTDAFNCISSVSTVINEPSFISSSQTLTICDGDSVTVGYSVYENSGSYTDTLTSMSGCDSVVYTNLTVNAPIDVSTSLNGLTISSNQSGAIYQWIDCNNSYLPLSGETNAIYSAFLNGNYAVIISLNSCTDTSACVSINGIGLEQPLNGFIPMVYPNPIENSFIIDLNTLQSMVEVELVNVQGQVIHKQRHYNVKRIPIELYLPSGIYHLKILFEDHFFTFILMK